MREELFVLGLYLVFAVLLAVWFVWRFGLRPDDGEFFHRLAAARNTYEVQHADDGFLSGAGVLRLFIVIWVLFGLVLLGLTVTGYEG